MKKNLIILVFMIIVLSGFVLSETDNSTQIEENHSIILKNVIPTNFRVGDSQFSIQIENAINETFTDVYARITGDGFSTYDVIPVDILEPYERGYILISCNFKKSGNITLTIKINSETFYKNVSVSQESSNQENQQNEEKKAKLENLTIELNNIKEKNNLIEQEIIDKKNKGYDVSQVSTSDLKRYTRDAQEAVLASDIQGAELNIILANLEYNDLKSLVDNTKKNFR